MTESPAAEPASGDACQRARNGLKPERNGLLRSLRRCRCRQPKHHCHPEEEEVRPGGGGSIHREEPDGAGGRQDATRSRLSRVDRVLMI